MKRALLIAILSLLALYVGDDLSVRYRIPSSRDPFGVVQVRPYYAVRLKDRKTEYYFLDPQNQKCVHSLFPHLGYSPCWYLQRKKQKRMDM
ncbi:MAG TPA: hypothetical protein VEU11_07340 [Terriglobales bacterium]|nr:hypothetical protein [Terriglobales bacterium]